MNNLLVQEVKGQMVVSSRQVADDFEKRHGHILDKITDLELEIQPTEKSVRYFIPSEYRDSKGELRKEYLLTRDGFTLAVMGFTGAKALQFKLKYIQAFNEMEQQLLTPKFQIPQTYAEALRQLADSTEKTERLAAIVEEQQPKVAYYDEVLDSTKLRTTTDIAKKLGLRSAQQLNEYLHEKGVIYPVKGKSYDSKKGVGKTVISNWNITAEYSYLVPEYADYAITKQGQTLKWKEKGRYLICEWVSSWLKK